MSKRVAVRDVLLDVKKALGVLTVMTGAAVGYGLIDSSTSGVTVGGIGVLAAGVTWLLNNEEHPARQDRRAGLGTEQRPRQPGQSRSTRPAARWPNAPKRPRPNR